MSFNYILIWLMMFVIVGVLPTAGIVAFLGYKILNRSVNLGDSTSGFDMYADSDIHYTFMSDGDLNTRMKTVIFREHGGNPYADRTHEVHEALKRSLDD